MALKAHRPALCIPYSALRNHIHTQSPAYYFGYNVEKLIQEAQLMLSEDDLVTYGKIYGVGTDKVCVCGTNTYVTCCSESFCLNPWDVPPFDLRSAYSLLLMCIHTANQMWHLPGMLNLTKDDGGRHHTE